MTTGMVMTRKDLEEERQRRCDHKWSDWKVTGHTGDWFHPHAVERKCITCGRTESDEH